MQILIKINNVEKMLAIDLLIVHIHFECRGRSGIEVMAGKRVIKNFCIIEKVTPYDYE